MQDTTAFSRMYGTGEVMRALHRYIRGDVLDFGAGKGRLKPLCLESCKSYTAFDLEPHPTVDIVGDVLNPSIPDSSYDTIISNQVMEHVSKPWVMVQHIARMLRPGGTCILTAPFLAPYHAHPDDYFRFTEQGMRSLCDDAGLQVRLCTKYGGYWSTVGELTKQKFCSPYRSNPRWRRLLGRLMEDFFRLLNGWTPPGIAYSNVLCIAEKPSPHDHEHPTHHG